MFSLNLLGFFIGCSMIEATFPQRVPIGRCARLGITSVLSATVYMSMMALYYAELVASQSELEREVQQPSRHRDRAARGQGGGGEGQPPQRPNSSPR